MDSFEMNNESLIFQAVETQITYVHGKSPPIVSGAAFVLKNPSGQVRTINCRKVEFFAGETGQQLGKYFIYSLPDHVELLPEKIELAPGQELELSISFPFITIKPEWGKSYFVRATVDTGGRSYVADSRLKIFRRDARVSHK